HPKSPRISPMQDLSSYVEQLGQRARRASDHLVTLDGATKITALKQTAQSLRDNKNKILDANANDIAAAQQSDLAPALIERLKLNEKRTNAMADSVDQIAAQTDPVGQTIEGQV